MLAKHFVVHILLWNIITCAGTTRHQIITFDIVSQLKKSYYQDCTVLNLVQNEPKSLLNHESITLSYEYLVKNKDLLTEFLHKYSRCILAIFEGSSSMNNLIQALHKVRKYTLIQVGGCLTDKKTLLNLKYPMIWVQPDNYIFPKNTTHTTKVKLSRICPKEDKTIPMTPHVFSVIYEYESNNEIPNHNCPGYLTGQNLVFGHIYNRQRHQINGQIVYGSYTVKLFEYISRRLKFQPIFRQGRPRYISKNDTWEGPPKWLQDGEVFMLRQSSSALLHRHFNLMFPHQHQGFYIVSRQPRALENSYAFLLPFSALLWNIIAFTLICFAILFYIIHSIYVMPIITQNMLHRTKEKYKTNFFIFTICKITEPDPLPWFSQRWSAGKLLVFLWSMFSLLFVSFYNCNLRAHLSAVDHEKEINTPQDVLDNGKTPWLMSELPGTSKAYLDASGQTDTPVYQMTLMAEKLGGVYSYSKNRGIPVEAINDIVDNRAVCVIGYSYLTGIRFAPQYQAALKGDKLYQPREPVWTAQFTMTLRKYSPANDEVQLVDMSAAEYGLVQKWLFEGMSMEAFLDYNKIKKFEAKKPMHFQQIWLPILCCVVIWFCAGCIFLWEHTSTVFKKHEALSIELHSRKIS